jgi:hydroxymethylbilane synthase
MVVSTTRTVIIGTRTSKLARWQAEHVSQGLKRAWSGLTCQIQPFVTKGDKTLDEPLPEIGGKGLFTAELEQALREGTIDVAVHSLKDRPVENAPGLTIGAILAREDVADGLVTGSGCLLAELPPGAVVGTSSLRRQAQLLAVRPDLEVKSIRGNVDTRIRKVRDGEYDAVVLAAAGLRRIGLEGAVAEWLSLSMMLPAPGQGALAVQCRNDDQITLELLSSIITALYCYQSRHLCHALRRTSFQLIANEN